MKSHSKPFITRLDRRELIRFCNEKLVCAARDLAEFTKNGVNASFIVALAHKCEHFEGTLNEPLQPSPSGSESVQTEKEIRDGIHKICELGQQIWSNHPVKYSDYAISFSANGLPEPGVA